jgi:hypothetical protein
VRLDVMLEDISSEKRVTDELAEHPAPAARCTRPSGRSRRRPRACFPPGRSRRRSRAARLRSISVAARRTRLVVVPRHRQTELGHDRCSTSECLDHHEPESFPNLMDAVGAFNEGVALYRGRASTARASGLSARCRRTRTTRSRGFTTTSVRR